MRAAKEEERRTIMTMWTLNAAVRMKMKMNGGVVTLRHKLACQQFLLAKMTRLHLCVSRHLRGLPMVLDWCPIAVLSVSARTKLAKRSFGHPILLVGTHSTGIV